MGKYILKTDFAAEMAARGVAFDSGFRHLFNTKVAKWIALVGGNLGKSADLLQELNTGLDEQLTTFTDPGRFHVLFEEE